jgi:hypothetical protein
MKRGGVVHLAQQSRVVTHGISINLNANMQVITIGNDDASGGRAQSLAECLFVTHSKAFSR